MKKLFDYATRSKAAIIATLAVLFVASTVVLAASLYAVSIPSHVNVVNPPPPPPPPADYTISVWADEALTTQLTDVEWGDVYTGSVTTKIVYVKNDGNQTVDIEVTSNCTSGTVTGSALNLAPGASGALTLTLTAGATPADNSFSVNIGSA